MNFQTNPGIQKDFHPHQELERINLPCLVVELQSVRPRVHAAAAASVAVLKRYEQGGELKIDHANDEYVLAECDAGRVWNGLDVASGVEKEYSTIVAAE